MLKGTDEMRKYAKILAFGGISWAIPFLVSLPLYSRDGQVAIDYNLFKSIMVVTGTLVGCILLAVYFKKQRASFGEGLRVGVIWYAVNVLLDLLILVPLSKLTIPEYFLQIGIRYLSIVIIGAFAGAIGSVGRETDA